MSVPTPAHDALFAIAQTQEGYFTTAQAREAGLSDQLLRKHVQNGRFERVMRAIYRLKHYPYTDHEDLIIGWLWSNRLGVFSHQTALSLHNLSDVFPSRYTMTVPPALTTSQRTPPDNLVLRVGKVPPADRSWYGPVLVTSVRRTIEDCIDALVDRLLIEQAIEEAFERGLISPQEISRLQAKLEASWSSSWWCRWPSSGW